MTVSGICRALLFLLCLPMLGLLGESGYGAVPASDAELVAVLRKGGLVIVMRHANSPRELPDTATVDPGNTAGERQLDEQGRNDALAFGTALRRLDIPVGAVGSSPAFRARQTAELAGFSELTIHPELGNEGMRDSGTEFAAWLLAEAARQPAVGNRLLITHGPNIAAAFPAMSEGMDEGEALVLDPAGGDEPALVARLKISQWPQL